MEGHLQQYKILADTINHTMIIKLNIHYMYVSIHSANVHVHICTLGCYMLLLLAAICTMCT